MTKNYKGKKALVMGLGFLGGGVATTKWLIRHGAVVTITDLETKKQLVSSLREFGDDVKKIRFVLGRHEEEDFKTHDVVVVNPGVPKESPFLEVARRAGKTLINEALIFFETVRNPIIAVTGTKGKTTAVNWITYFLKAKWQEAEPVGNSAKTAFLAAIEKVGKKKNLPIVVELSSWHLEFLDRAKRAPDIALITNIFEDHMNRYETMEEYAEVKTNIFKNQNKNQVLILNDGNQWTRFFLAKKPRAKLLFFSGKPLPATKSGIFINNGVWFRDGKKTEKILDKEFLMKITGWGEHNLENLLAAMLAAKLIGVGWQDIRERISSLPEVPYREEIILKKEGIRVINDSAATSPEATIAGLKRFAENNKENVVLVVGGTDKKLKYEELAKKIKKYIKPSELLLLDGSATQKLMAELKKIKYKKGEYRIFESLEEVGQTLKKMTFHDKTTILFSPGAASFEKFKNEFDRGEIFNKMVQRLF